VNSGSAACTATGRCCGGEAVGSKRYFYCQDANWNVIALRHGLDIIERYEYDPYGNVRIFKGYDPAEGHEDLTVVGDSVVRDATDPPLAYGNPILFAGYFYDNETGLYHVRHRMYSPTLARWLQRDPAGLVDGLNEYQYVRNRPPTGLDPLGLKTNVCCKYESPEPANWPSVGPVHPRKLTLKQDTIECEEGSTPEECCECYIKKIPGAMLHSAKSGKCCSCKMELRAGRLEGFLRYCYFGPFYHCGINVDCDDGQRAFFNPLPSCGLLFYIDMYFDPTRIEPILQYRLPDVERTIQIDCECLDKVIQYAQSWNGVWYNSVLMNCHVFCYNVMMFGELSCYH